MQWQIAIGVSSCVMTAGVFGAEPDLPSSPQPKLEGALGVVATYQPEYAGGARRRLHADPGFFLRYGRYSVSTTSAFVTRRSDEVFRGLSGDLLQRQDFRLNLALRIDRGRKSSTSSALSGIEDVRPTLLGRMSATWILPSAPGAARWRLGLGLSTDLLGRGQGQLMDLGVVRDAQVSPRTTWSNSASISAASATYMIRRYGVSPGESARTGYPEYRPGAGLRDISYGTGWRTEFGDTWIAFWGVSASRQLGPAADSPLSRRPFGWGLNGGIARRF
ncbi:MAG TPA: MipA/OmpV family protein [Burkholderiaceae bacterium]|nr:MipA/OmpV family protein [Burkholderiaceae bacterium]